jgi:cyclase
VNPTQPLNEETVFDLGNCTAEVLFTPGHTSTNLSIWVPQERILFTGDCLINGYAPNLESGGPADWRIWLKSLDRIEALRPKAVLAGHGPVAHEDEIPSILETVRRVLKESIERGCSQNA